MLKKIWKDPVGSKVISWIIIGILTLIILKIKSSYDEVSFTETFSELINFKVKLIYVLLSFFLFFASRFIIRKKKGYYRQKLLRNFNNSVNNEQGILYKWTVYFGDDGNPLITDLDLFCMEHGEVPIRFYGDKCSVDGCKNSKANINFDLLENYIESIVLNEWGKINK